MCRMQGKTKDKSVDSKIAKYCDAMCIVYSLCLGLNGVFYCLVFLSGFKRFLSAVLIGAS